MTAQLIELNDVKPKTVRHQYKRVPIKLRYVPKDKEWKWEVTIVTSTAYGEHSDSEARALRDAKKYIDKNGLGKDL